MNKLIHEELTREILGACFEVYRDKGAGFLEAVFQECLELELADRGIPFAAQPRVSLSCKGRPLKQTFSPDFVCFDRVILEIKAVSKICDEHRAQIQNYLHASGLRVGLLVNFGHHPKAEFERFVL